MKSQKSVRISPKIIYGISMEKKKQLRVSARSKYCDSQWIFTEEIPNKNITDVKKTISWDKIIFFDGTRLTDTGHSELFESAKDFIFSLLYQSGGGTYRIKHNTIISIMTDLRKLLRWMVKKGFCKFKQLDKSACSSYVMYLKTQSIKKSSLTHNLSILVKLFQQKAIINDGIAEHPFQYESARSVAGFGSKDMEKNKTLRIPEEVLTSLVGTALNYIEDKAPEIIENKTEYDRIKEESKHLGQRLKKKESLALLKVKALKVFQHLKKSCGI